MAVFLCRAGLYDISAFGTLFWSGKRLCMKVLLFAAKFSSIVWRKMVHSDVAIIPISQSLMVFLTEPPWRNACLCLALGVLMLYCIAYTALNLPSVCFSSSHVLILMSYFQSHLSVPKHFLHTNIICQWHPNHSLRQLRRGIPKFWCQINEITFCWVFVWISPFIICYKLF